MSDPARPDAVLYQDRHKAAGGPDPLDRVLYVRRWLGPVLGCDRPFSRNVPGVGWLCTPTLDDSTYLTHDRRPRYRWEPQPDGTQFGYRLDKSSC